MSNFGMSIFSQIDSATCSIVLENKYVVEIMEENCKIFLIKKSIKEQNAKDIITEKKTKAKKIAAKFMTKLLQ